jgi:hypothetical protein
MAKSTCSAPTCLLARLRQDGAASVINRAHARSDNQNLTGIFDNVTTANSAVFAAEPAGKLQNADCPWGSKMFRNTEQKYRNTRNTRNTEKYGPRNTEKYGDSV